MHLSTVTINNVRKITSAELTLSPSNNIIVGANGSGKTTFLESIYLLSGGRSFRTSRSKEIIQHEAGRLTITGNLEVAEKSYFLGIEKTKTNTRLRLDNENVASASLVVRRLPMLVLNTESFRLLEGGPSNRRDLIDRLLFHVEQDYLDSLKRFYHLLKQRNASLRRGLPEKEVRLWNEPLSVAGLEIDSLRDQQIAILNAALKGTGIDEITGSVKIDYERGWKKETSLLETLEASLNKDRMLGTTTSGPHRAELKIYADGRPAKASLSRGQTKLVVAAIIVAMGESIANAVGTPPILLVDDLASELDNLTKSKAIQLLMGLKTQAFFSAIEYNLLEELSSLNPSVFHVEQGLVERLS